MCEFKTCQKNKDEKVVTHTLTQNNPKYKNQPLN